VSSLRSQTSEHHGIDWLGFVRTLLVQVFVLFALSGAVIGYLKWSSDAAWAEFIAANKTSALDPRHQQHSVVPAQSVGRSTIYLRRA
jgi:hypothetical protein